jgi:hypothetical protein
MRGTGSRRPVSRWWISTVSLARSAMSRRALSGLNATDPIRVAFSMMADCRPVGTS